MFIIRVVIFILILPSMAFAGRVRFVNIQIQSADKIVLEAGTHSSVTIGGRVYHFESNRLVFTIAGSGSRAGGAGISINNMRFNYSKLEVWPAKGSVVVVRSRGGRSYDGDMVIRLVGGRLHLVNRVEMEDYVASVVASEISPDWHIEILKAQAVASRTYAYYKSGSGGTLADTVVDQVYYGRQNINAGVRRAVRETSGQVLTYNGKMALTLFHSTSVGMTEAAANLWDHVDHPYLRSVACPNDRASPMYAWEKRFKYDIISDRFNKSGYHVGKITRVSPFYRDGSMRVVKVGITGSGGHFVVSGNDMRKLMGYDNLPSTMFKVKQQGRGVLFLGQGYGHGVGLCQYGAKWMAEQGTRFDRILQHYYPGTRLEKL